MLVPPLPFIKYFQHFILIMCFVYMLSYGESKSTTSCVLLSMSKYDEYSLLISDVKIFKKYAFSYKKTLCGERQIVL